MKKYITTLIFIVIIATATENIAQNQNISKSNSDSETLIKHHIGFGAGITTGYGLSYRFTINQVGLQINYSPYIEEDRQTHSNGITLLYKIVDGTNINFFAYQGNHLWYRERLQRYYSPYQSDKIKVTRDWFNGLGFGFEFVFYDGLSFNIMGGYAAYKNFSEVNFTIETGFYYIF